MEIERRILLVDGPDGELQQLALDLMGRNFGVQYANDLDEAQLIASEARNTIFAVLIDSSLPLERVPDLARRFGVVTSALIPVGARPADRAVAALAFHGVRWHLWDDPPDASIRFVISNVLFENDPLELRYHLRVPTNLPARVEVGERKCETSIRDISMGGACLMGDAIGAIGDPGILHFTVEDCEISIPTRVAWTVGEGNDDLNVVGVSFQEVDPEAGTAIDHLRKSVVAPHRIRKPVSDR